MRVYVTCYERDHCLCKRTNADVFHDFMHEEWTFCAKVAIKVFSLEVLATADTIDDLEPEKLVQLRTAFKKKFLK